MSSPDGSTSFNALHSKGRARVAYFIVDLLLHEGEERLRKLLLTAPNSLCLVNYFAGEGPRVFGVVSACIASGVWLTATSASR